MGSGGARVEGGGFRVGDALGLRSEWSLAELCFLRNSLSSALWFGGKAHRGIGCDLMAVAAGSGAGSRGELFNRAGNNLLKPVDWLF